MILQSDRPNSRAASERRGFRSAGSTHRGRSGARDAAYALPAAVRRPQPEPLAQDLRKLICVSRAPKVTVVIHSCGRPVTFATSHNAIRSGAGFWQTEWLQITNSPKRAPAQMTSANRYFRRFQRALCARNASQGRNRRGCGRTGGFASSWRLRLRSSMAYTGRRASDPSPCRPPTAHNTAHSPPLRRLRATAPAAPVPRAHAPPAPHAAGSARHWVGPGARRDP